MSSATTLSSITHFHTTPSSTHPSTFPKQSLNFPFQILPKPLRRCATLRPLRAVENPSYVFDLGDQIYNLTIHRRVTIRPVEPPSSVGDKISLADAQKIVEYLQDVPAAAAKAPVVEEKAKFDVVIEDVPGNARIVTIKVVKALTGMGLKDAYGLIKGLPNKLKEAISKEEAEEFKEQLEEAGAKISIV